MPMFPAGGRVLLEEAGGGRQQWRASSSQCLHCLCGESDICIDNNSTRACEYLLPSPHRRRVQVVHQRQDGGHGREGLLGQLVHPPGLDRLFLWVDLS